MAAVSKINYRPGKERFYGHIFGDKADQAMTSDQEIWASLARLNIFEALGKLHHKSLIVTEVAAVIALSACNAIIKGQDRLEAPVAAKPQIAYFTRGTIQGDPTLESQLTGVQGLSGKGVGCNPAIVMVEGGNAGGETAGFCTKDNVITNLVVRGERNSTQQTVNEDLTTRKHIGPDGKPDIGYIEYGSGDKKGTLFTYDYATKITTWHFPGGGIMEFPTAQGPFEELVGKILEPGGVAVAAEIDTPTPTATLRPATPTKLPTDAPTLVPATEVPVQFKTADQYINDPNGKWPDLNTASNARWRQSSIVPRFDGSHLSLATVAKVTVKDYIPSTDRPGPGKAIFGFKVGEKHYLFMVSVAPMNCKADGGYIPNGLSLLNRGEGEIGVMNLLFRMNNSDALNIQNSDCKFISELKIFGDFSYFRGENTSLADKIYDLSGKLVLWALEK